MNLTTHYMGLRLRNPLIASSSPLTGELGTLRALEDHGAAAVVLPSLSQEQLSGERAAYERSEFLAASGSPEAQTYFPVDGEPAGGAQRYLRALERAKHALEIPVIASLNCLSTECWRECAVQLAQAGADAIELNLGATPPALELSGSEVEQSCVQAVAAVRAAVHIPLAVKLGPYFSSIGAMARALRAAGADALVLFNRFYPPQIDIRTLHVCARIELSGAGESRLPLLWIALLHGRFDVSLGASTGVHDADDVYKFLLAGADTVMSASALLRHGPTYLHELLAGLEALLAARGLDSLEQVRGRLSQQHLGGSNAQVRRDYLEMLRAAHIAPGSPEPGSTGSLDVT